MCDKENGAEGLEHGPNQSQAFGPKICDQVLHAARDLVRLQQAQQPCEPDNPRASHGHDVGEGAIGQGEDVGGDDGQVESKPGRRIPARHPPPVHDKCAVRGEMPGVELDHDVDRPEHASDPSAREGDIEVPRDHHREGEGVIQDDEHPEHVPASHPRAAGPEGNDSQPLPQGHIGAQLATDGAERRTRHLCVEAAEVLVPEGPGGAVLRLPLDLVGSEEVPPHAVQHELRGGGVARDPVGQPNRLLRVLDGPMLLLAA
mmetsp:Transcript_44002/g.128118  ORF Transcript_44002/g.128118 Transcript_44002/m.128118 type:complete len:259 (+) Transcript_44002:1123-1899(+)